MTVTSGRARDYPFAEGGLTSGFYVLTLVMAFAATAEVGIRLPGMPTLTPVELVGYPVALCVMAEMALRPRLAQRMRALYRRNRPLVWYAGYAAFAVVLRLARATDLLQSYKDVVPGLVIYALIFLTVDTHRRVLGLLLANLGGVLVSVGLGLSQIFFDGPYPLHLSAHIEAKQDLAGEALEHVATGLYVHPNGFAVVLLPVVLFLMCASWPGLNHPRRLRVVMLGLLATTVFVLMMTYVKGVYVWIAAAALFLAIPRRLDGWRFRAAVAMVVLGILSIVWLSIGAFLEGEKSLGTIVSRVELWLAAIGALTSNAFMAVFGGSGSLMEQQALTTIEYGNAHNAWINQALTYGLPALGLYLASFATALRSLGRTVEMATWPRRTVALATMASLMGLLGEAFFEPLDRGIVFHVQAFTLLALAAVYAPSPRSRTRSAPELA